MQFINHIDETKTHNSPGGRFGHDQGSKPGHPSNSTDSGGPDSLEVRSKENEKIGRALFEKSGFKY